MKDVIRTVSLAATFLFTAKYAVADDCDRLRSAMSAARSDFVALMGPQRDYIDGTKYYATDFRLDILHECAIMNDTRESRWVMSCGNGVSSTHHRVDYAAVRATIPNCGFRVRHELKLSGDGMLYEIVTDDRQVVILSTDFSSRSNSAHIRIKLKR